MGPETKTPKSRRTIALPEMVVEILTEQQESRADRGWKSEGIVYVFGTPYDTAAGAGHP